MVKKLEPKHDYYIQILVILTCFIKGLNLLKLLVPIMKNGVLLLHEENFGMNLKITWFKTLKAGVFSNQDQL